MEIDPGAVLTWLGQNFFVLLVPVLVWQANLLRQVAQTIYGVKGDNGLQGYVKELRKRTHEQHDLLKSHEGVIGRHKERLDGHDSELASLRSR